MPHKHLADFCGIAVPCQHDFAKPLGTQNLSFRCSTNVKKSQLISVAGKPQKSTSTYGVTYQYDAVVLKCVALCIANARFVVGRLGILIGGSALHHGQSVVNVPINSAMAARKSANTAFGGVAVSLYEPSNRRTPFTTPTSKV
jgi:hypothetical protein